MDGSLRVNGVRSETLIEKFGAETLRVTDRYIRFAENCWVLPKSVPHLSNKLHEISALESRTYWQHRTINHITQCCITNSSLQTKVSLN